MHYPFYLSIHFRNSDTFEDAKGATGIRGDLQAFNENLPAAESQSLSGAALAKPIFKRGDGYAYLKDTSDWEGFAPAEYCCEMQLYTPRKGAKPMRVLRILAVPVVNASGKVRYSDSFMIHAAKMPSQLKGCVAPDGWDLEELWAALGGWKVGKQFPLTVRNL